jgi:hypothetical protein
MTSYLNEEKSESPPELNIFVEDLIEQMVRLLMGRVITYGQSLTSTNGSSVFHRSSYLSICFAANTVCGYGAFYSRTDG